MSIVGFTLVIGPNNSFLMPYGIGRGVFVVPKSMVPMVCILTLKNAATFGIDDSFICKHNNISFYDSYIIMSIQHKFLYRN